MNRMYSFIVAVTIFTLAFSAVVSSSQATNATNDQININKVNNYGVVENSSTTISNSGVNGSQATGGNVYSNTSGTSGSVGGSGNGGNTSGNANANSTTIGGNAGSTIQTGNVYSNSSVTNCVNTTVIGSGQNPCVAKPTPTPTPGGGNGGNGGGSNGGGGSSGSSGNGSSGGSSGSSQAVLGEMASTGTFADNMMNLVAVAGLGLLLVSSYLTLKDKRLSFELQIVH